MYDLYLGNKNYSSWSLRPWLVMKHFGIPFREHLVSVAGRPFNPALKPIAGNGRVPCLHHADGFQVWDSLAIIETLAESEARIWPATRVRARTSTADGKRRSTQARPSGKMMRSSNQPSKGMKSGTRSIGLSA